MRRGFAPHRLYPGRSSRPVQAEQLLLEEPVPLPRRELEKCFPVPSFEFDAGGGPARAATTLSGTKWLYYEHGMEFAKGDEVDSSLIRYIVAVGDHGILDNVFGIR